MVLSELSQMSLSSSSCDSSESRVSQVLLRLSTCGRLGRRKDLNVLVIFFVVRCLGRKGVADFPPLAYTRNRNWTDSPFLQSLPSPAALFVRRSQDENRVLDLVFVRKRTDWQVNGRSWAVLWMIDVFKKLQKIRNCRIPRGGGGVGRECAKLTLRE